MYGIYQHKYQLNVGKYTVVPMDPMGYRKNLAQTYIWDMHLAVIRAELLHQFLARLEMLWPCRFWVLVWGSQ